MSQFGINFINLINFPNVQQTTFLFPVYNVMIC